LAAEGERWRIWNKKKRKCRNGRKRKGEMGEGGRTFFVSCFSFSCLFLSSTKAKLAREL
jgi:hypothetical protein